MKTKFNFNSQICTTREQSERLIEMALKDLLICGISFVFNDYSYDKVIKLIEFQINNGRFPKEYLV